MQRRTISCCHELNPDFVDHDQQSVVEARARKGRAYRYADTEAASIAMGPGQSDPIALRLAIN